MMSSQDPRIFLVCKGNFLVYNVKKECAEKILNNYLRDHGKAVITVQKVSDGTLKATNGVDGADSSSLQVEEHYMYFLDVSDITLAKMIDYVDGIEAESESTFGEQEINLGRARDERFLEALDERTTEFVQPSWKRHQGNNSSGSWTATMGLTSQESKLMRIFRDLPVISPDAYCPKN